MKLSHERLKQLCEPGIPGTDSMEMARELLDARANASGWSIELGALRASLKQVDEEYRLLKKQFITAERVIAAAAKVMTCNYPWPKYGEALDEALRAHDGEATDETPLGESLCEACNEVEGDE